MRDPRHILKQRYNTSHALVIGINKYPSPLNYAVSDAKEIKDILISELGFGSKNVMYLTDSNATKANILEAFSSFTSEEVKVDDRLFVFFAGHGYTRTGSRGEVGFLVPYGADMNNLSSLIRWDELTRNAELIMAKHVLFVMDACYGGLAVNRSVQPGGRRFLKDMYQRFSRQVITAGKADEVVSDTGGPLPNHSVFTGHLIEGIRGKAADEQGIITASTLMSYVYKKVATDKNSKQTPHYGQFDGDGDFVISAPNISELSEDEGKDTDKLILAPYSEATTDDITLEEKISHVKDLLSSQKYPKIELHDLATSEVRKFLSLTSENHFVATGNFSQKEFSEKISSYERYTEDLQAIVAMLVYWAHDSDLNILGKIISLISDQSGLTASSNFRWYSLLLLLYHAGIAATESKNYSRLTRIFHTKCRGEGGEALFALKVSDWIIDITIKEWFELIPAYKRHYTPLSDHIFRHIQPLLDNLFSMGSSYEDAFDEFEILYALTVADLDLRERNLGVRAPIGRFGWKYRRSRNSPFAKLRSEATSLREQWPPIKAGMFGGDYARFEEIANKFDIHVLQHLKWF